ncbi:MAG TPA: hypothetical protein VGE69_14700 [Pseudomonadales bacterium]
MAKHGKIKIPKRVAGVKIPKPIRKGAIGHFLNSRAGQLVIAETLVAAAAAFTAVKADDTGKVADTLKNPVDSIRRAGEAVAGASANEGERFAHAFRAACRAFVDALRDGEGTSWRAPVAEDAPVKKPGRASGPH